MDKCRQFGHAYKTIAEFKNQRREKCTECGVEHTFDVHNWQGEKEYAKQHHRDWIQPGQEGFEECYGKKVNVQ